MILSLRFLKSKKFCYLFLIVALLACLGGCSSPNMLREKVTSELDTLSLNNHEYDLEFDEFGTVKLNGWVSSQFDKDKIETAVSQTPGVHKVNNLLEVRQDKGGASPADIALMGQVKKDIEEESLNGGGYMRASLDGGVLKLSGVVPEEKNRERIYSRVSKLWRGPVVDEIVIGPELSDEEVQSKISKNLSADPQVQQSDLSYSVTHGVVSVSGRSAAHRDIDRVLSIINMTDGVKAVRSTVQYPEPYNPH